jgi:gliding motility-associated-like protein
MFYRYIGPGTQANTLRYEVTLRLFRDCSASGAMVAPMPAEVYISIFDNLNDGRINDNLVPRDYSMDEHLQKQDFSCIQFAPEVCYDVSYFHVQVDLPKNAKGYTCSFQTCCRVGGINNIENNFGSVNGSPGVTMSCKISGTDLLGETGTNSSPVFRLKDTALVCSDNFFSLDFGAIDADNDSLSFSLCSAYGCVSTIVSAENTPSGKPTNTVFPVLSYTNGFSGSNPLGSAITINPVTGIISGIAPSISGRYVINVCIDEWRNKVLIGSHRKDFILKIADCNKTSAKLDLQYLSCDGFTLTFSNNTTTISGTQYEWNFGDTATALNNFSADPNASHTYSDTGTYKLKLRVSFNGQCADSATALVKVYPGFAPAFDSLGPFCKGVPLFFKDQTTTRYGVPTGWRWDFGNLAATNDTSLLQNPFYVYPDTGTYNVQLIVGNTFGCIDTISNPLKVNGSPVIELVPHDTLICVTDTLQLKINNTGNYTWSPNYNINSLTSASPLVSPDVPTKYFVSLRDGFGCVSRDSVFVDVRAAVTIDAGNDTIICRTDGLLLNTTSDALYYTWTPATYLSSDTAKHPFANPLDAVTTYHVVGSIGKCRDSADVKITTLPYPLAYAGKDTTVCFGFTAVLMASGGRTYQWSPARFLSATNIPNPTVIHPTATTQYTVAVRDIVGCPKPAYDTVMVNVDPLVVANAGPADTTVVLGEPMFLNGTGGQTYLWQPPTWLNNPAISNPIASPEDNITYHLLVTSTNGCESRDSIRIKLYKVPPSFYVPTAFTPNNDNSNDILKPIILGMRTLDYFRVFDRWGKLLFYTAQKGQGWDGTFKGNPQDPGAYVWMAGGTTYTGEVIVRKGYVVLIR